MVASMRRFGQMSPVVCCLREERPRLIDGFRRLWAGRRIPEIRELSTRLIEVDDREAKAAILRLNQSGRRMHVLEEAWLAYALVCVRTGCRSCRRTPRAARHLLPGRQQAEPGRAPGLPCVLYVARSGLPGLVALQPESSPRLLPNGTSVVSDRRSC